VGVGAAKSYFKFGGWGCGWERMAWGCDGDRGDCLLVIYILIHQRGDGGESMMMMGKIIYCYRQSCYYLYLDYHSYYTIIIFGEHTNIG
jgi:hypothetical protein